MPCTGPRDFASGTGVGSCSTRPPGRCRSDPALRLAAAVFVVSFLICALVAAAQPEFARQVVGDKVLESIDHMYSRPIESPGKEGAARDDTAMAGFYIQHNTSIGLKCFAWGILFGVGSLFQLLSNGIGAGHSFGHMAVSPHASQFLHLRDRALRASS